LSIRPVGLVRLGFRRLGSSSSGGLPYVTPLIAQAVLYVNAAGTKATTSSGLLYEDSDGTLAVLLDGTSYTPITDKAGLTVKKTSGAISAIFDGGGSSNNILQLRNGGGGSRDSIISTNVSGFQVGGNAAGGFDNAGVTFDPGTPGNAQITATAGHFVVSNGSFPIVDINGTSNLQMQVDGTAANPALGFVGSAGLGLYRSAANVLSVAVSAAELARFTATGVGFPNGAVGAPAGFFINSTTTGFYRSAANTFAIAANGTAALVVSQNQVIARPGAVATPSIVLTSGDTTGLYRNAANDVAFAAGSARQGGWTSNGLYFLNKVSFFGATAVGQRAKTGTPPAGAAYTANEQALLNDCVNTLLGLGVLI
jgi:hypothetical protein